MTDHGVTLNLRYHPVQGTINETKVEDGIISHAERKLSSGSEDDMLRTMWEAQEVEDPCFHDGVGLVKYQSGRVILVIVTNCHKIRTKEEMERNPVSRTVVLSDAGETTNESQEK